MKVGEITAITPPNILIWGKFGRGKTALAMTLGENAQLHDLDSGYRTGATLKDKWLETRRKVDLVPYPEPAPHKRATIFKMFKERVYSISDQVAKGTFPYDAVITDSLTMLGTSALAMVMGNSGSLETKPEIQHWGLAFEEVKKVLDVLHAMPIVSVVIGHEDIRQIDSGVTDKNGKPIKKDKVEIAISGKNMPEQICRKFDEIWYMKVKPAGAGSNKYVIQTQPDAIVAARTRNQVPNDLDVECGLWKIIEGMGYVPPIRQPKS